MTSVATELDFTVLEDLDFAPSCDMEGHGEAGLSCDNGPAVWIVEEVHECAKKTRVICDGFKRAMENVGKNWDDPICSECRQVVTFEEYFRVVGKL